MAKGEHVVDIQLMFHDKDEATIILRKDRAVNELYEKLADVLKEAVGPVVIEPMEERSREEGRNTVIDYRICLIPMIKSGGRYFQAEEL